MAHALLCPAGAIARARPAPPAPPLAVLPIDELTLPDEGVCDLRDVVDAINKLCETMKTSACDEVCDDSADADADVEARDVVAADALSYSASFASFSRDTASSCSQDDTDQSLNASCGAAPLCESSADAVEPEPEVARADYGDVELVSPEDTAPQKVETKNVERWSDSASQVSLPGQVEDVETITSDTEPALAQCEPASEMYYTASSEVSLLSDTELPEKMHTEDENKEAQDERKECVIAGHVAAMRERFESMTRTGTPCPDLVRSLSPSLEVFRTTSSSPDRLA